ncbi:MAG: hypothetical protein D6732_17060, partial [Methanobacteriota archaeon]
MESIAIAHPERIKFKHLTIEDGLSQSSVFGIAQDRMGFLWFGTTDGLNRFDGYEFVTYRYQPGVIKGLTNNRIYSLYVDQDANLWIGTGGRGLNRYDPDTDSFVHYTLSTNNNFSGSSDYIKEIYQDRQKNLWIGTRGSGVFLFDQKADKILALHERIGNNPQTIPTNITSFVQFKDEVWIGSEDAGIFIYKFATNKLEPFRPSLVKNSSFSATFIPELWADGDSILWIGTFQDGLYKYRVKTQTFESFLGQEELSKKNITALRRDQKGELWIGTSSGLYRLNETQRLFQNYHHDPSEASSLSNDLVINIFEDHSGGLWIGTEGNGLSIVIRDPQYFHTINHLSNNGKGLNSNIVNSIVEDAQGFLWVGSDKGFNRVNRHTNHIDNVLEDAYASAMSIAVDSLGNLWLATFRDGLYAPKHQFPAKLQLPLKNHNFYFANLRNQMDDSTSLSTNLILSIYFDQSHNLWIGSDGGGLNQLIDPQAGSFIRYMKDPHDPHSINDNDVWCIYESPSEKDSILWIGTASGGLNKFNRKTNRFTHYMHDPNNLQSISANRVYVIHESQDDILWLGTDGGLNKFNRATGSFEYFGTNIGFPNDVIYGILEDDLGKLWLSTNMGLVQFNPHTLEVKTFSVKDGLPSNEFNARAFYKNKKGEFFFGCLGGLVYFHPEDIPDHKSEFIPPVVITRFVHYNSDHTDSAPIIDRTINRKEKIILTHRDNILTFEFAALNFFNNHKNQYAYKLEGFTENWISLGSQRQVTLTNLDPGEYTLRIKGSNEDGVWNETGTSLMLTILPPWWKTWWAYTLYVLIIIALIYGFRRS